MGPALGIEILNPCLVRPALWPIGTQGDEGTCGNGPVALFADLCVSERHLIILIADHLVMYISHH